jgi:hypothetical protein
LDIAKTVERHNSQLQQRTASSTLKVYRIVFARYARFCGLENLTRRQLRTSKGRTTLIGFITAQPEKSRRPILSALKSYWAYGLDIHEWPIDPKIDLPRMPPIGRRQTPPDSKVSAWRSCLAHETDDYDRLVWLFASQYGWCENQAAGLTWNAVQRSDDGAPYAITATREKTKSAVNAWLFPDVVVALSAWERECPWRQPGDYILPWRSGTRFERRRMTARMVFHRWLRLEKKWNLQTLHLRPSDCRHWVNTVGRRVSLSKPALAALCGHDSSRGLTYADWYDNPGPDDLFAEQKKALPRGPLGTLIEQPAQLLDDVPREAVSIVARFFKNEVSLADMADELDRVRVLYAPKWPEKMFYTP